MKNKRNVVAIPPKRKELSDNPVKLCNEIARLFRGIMRESDDYDGIMSQHGAHLVLGTLAISDGISQLELVKATHLSAPTVSVIIKRMESEGIIEKKSNPNDLRSFSIYLTDKGRKLDSDNIKKIKKLDSVALEGISKEEFDTLMVLLSKLRDNLLISRECKTEGEE